MSQRQDHDVKPWSRTLSRREFVIALAKIAALLMGPLAGCSPSEQAATPSMSTSMPATTAAAPTAAGPTPTPTAANTPTPACSIDDKGKGANVIVILPDALRADRLSCYGYTENQTPHVDALAHDAVLYRYMTAPAAWTKPSVATILTSMYPSSHRVRETDDALPDEATTLPEVLAVHGYHTAAMVTNPYLRAKAFNFQQGYDEYHWLGPEDSSWTLDDESYYQEAALVNQQILAWLEARRNQDQPFFLYVHYMDPHQPYFEHPYNGRGEDPRGQDAAAASLDIAPTILGVVGIEQPATMLGTSAVGRKYSTG